MADEPLSARAAILACLRDASEPMTLRDIVGACCCHDAEGNLRAAGVQHHLGYSRRAQYVYQMALGRLMATGEVVRLWPARALRVNRYRLAAAGLLRKEGESDE